MIPGQVSKTALHAVAHDGVADRLAHDEPDTCRSLDLPGIRAVEVHDKRPRARSPTSCCGAERVRIRQTMVRRQHRGSREDGGEAVRPRVPCDPCGDATRGWRGRRGCACAGGTRAPCGDDGCSAGTYACSRASLSVGCSGLSTGGSAPPSDCGNDRRSTPDDRPTVRAAIPQGQTDAGRRQDQPTRPGPSLWMTACRCRRARDTFVAPRFPATPCATTCPWPAPPGLRNRTTAS